MNSRGPFAQAKAAYEKVLELNPRFGPAANNLAYLYSEYGGDKEKALALAQRAKEELPEDPMSPIRWAGFSISEASMSRH